MFRLGKSLVLLALVASFSTPAFAREPLHENRTVRAGFYAIGLADTLRDNCADFSARYLRAFNYLKALEKYARSQGYTSAEIEELTDNRLEKQKLRAEIAADLAARGATRENPEGYCTVGREEIAKNSAAGRLLRAR